jgi:hypothetical protein
MLFIMRQGGAVTKREQHNSNPGGSSVWQLELSGDDDYVCQEISDGLSLSDIVSVLLAKYVEDDPDIEGERNVLVAGTLTNRDTGERYNVRAAYDLYVYNKKSLDRLNTME